MQDRPHIFHTESRGGLDFITRVFLKANPEEFEYPIKNSEKYSRPNHDWNCYERDRIMTSGKVVVNEHDVPIKEATSKTNRRNHQKPPRDREFLHRVLWPFFHKVKLPVGLSGAIPRHPPAAVFQSYSCEAIDR